MPHTPWLSRLLREDRGMPASGSVPHSLSLMEKGWGWFPAGHPPPLASRLLDCPRSFRLADATLDGQRGTVYQESASSISAFPFGAVLS